MHPILALSPFLRAPVVRSAGLRANLGHLGKFWLLVWTCQQPRMAWQGEFVGQRFYLCRFSAFVIVVGFDFEGVGGEGLLHMVYQGLLRFFAVAFECQ